MGFLLTCLVWVGNATADVIWTLAEDGTNTVATASGSITSKFLTSNFGSWAVGGFNLQYGAHVTPNDQDFVALSNDGTGWYHSAAGSGVVSLFDNPLMWKATPDQHMGTFGHHFVRLILPDAASDTLLCTTELVGGQFVHTCPTGEFPIVDVSMTWTGLGINEVIEDWVDDRIELFSISGHEGSDVVYLEVHRVPEPTTFALMGLGLAGIGYRRHRSKKAA